MSEARIGFGEDEPSAEHSAISVADVRQLLPRLNKKLAEYRQRIQDGGLHLVHPELLALQGRLEGILKPFILESVIELADCKGDKERVYLHEVAVLVQDKIGINVSRAATIPYVRNGSGGNYGPDILRLEQEASQEDLDFSRAYAIVRGYCSGEVGGVVGGTGLPGV